jgi:stearoyl-CoA desaturase (delta-9 desaturase)
VAEFLLMYFITGCLGITLSYHRQLTHRSFTTPKWLERVLAYCGVMAVQGDPLEWVSCHRYHHLHCETPLDPHSVYEGFWWSHMGWLLDDRATQSRVHDTSNATDISRDPFYAHLSKHYGLHVVGMFVAIFLLGGLDSLLWAGCLRCAWVYHITWFVNSAAHVWGTQEYETGGCPLPSLETRCCWLKHPMGSTC